MQSQNSTRLNKYISESGICSRREADRFIEQGNVFINGKRAKIGDRVKPGDTVKVNGNIIEPRESSQHVYIALNKPVGVTSTTEEGVKDNIVNFVNHSSRIFPIGRLDKDSQGLIFLTSNGDIVNKILRASNNHEKEYFVTVDKPITDDFILKMASGVPVLGTVTKKCKVVKESPFVFSIVLIQGLNRQIRRMCEYFEYNVVKLERVRIMNVHLKGIPPGEWRELTPAELQGVFSMIEGSDSEINTSSKAQKKSNSKNSKSTGHKKSFKPGNSQKNKHKGSARPKFNRSGSANK
jgi:23S rRNA pseudouridine2604 synthase